MKKYTLLIAILLAISGLQAQLTVEREVFSSVGDLTTSGTISFSYTGGEAIIGTVTSGSLNFLQGYQVPSDMATSIESELEPGLQLSIFPNPVADELSVRFEGILTQPVELQLYDATGKVISGFSAEVRQTGTVSRNVGQLASGAYFLRIQRTDGAVLRTLPVIKQ